MARPTTHRVLNAALLSAVLLAACGNPSEAEQIASAQQSMDKKDLPAAIIQLKGVLQKQPDSERARLLLGRALLDSGDPSAGLVELTKAQELGAADNDVVPAIARAMLLLGDDARVVAQFGETRLSEPTAAADLFTTVATAHTVKGDLDKAQAALARAQQMAPDYAPAAVLKARLTAATNDFDGALALLGQILAKGDPGGHAAQLKGDVLWQGKKDLAGALEAYRAVVAAHPNAVGAHTAIITILGSQGKADEAKAQIEALKKALPNHPESLFFSAQLAFADKDYKRSRELTDRLLKGMPDNPRVLELAGAAEYALGHHAQAEAFLSKALKVAPGLTLSRRLLAQTYLRSNQPNKVVELMRPVIEGKDPDGASLALAAEAWGQMGDTRQADATFALAAKAAPGDSRVRTSAALAQLARGDANAAIGQLEAIAAEDKGTRADIALISARMRQNDSAGALKAIEGLQQKTPERPLAPHLRGRVLLAQRDLAGAAKAFEAALAKDPAYFPSIASLAAMELTAGKPELARQRFESAAKADPKRHEPWLALAELSARQGSPSEEVQRYLRKAVAANAGEPAPHLALINHLIASGDGAGALAAAREASAAMPLNLDVLEALGRSQQAAKDPVQAMATYRQLLVQRPTDPYAHLRLSDALSSNGDFEGARRSINKALELSPNLLVAKRALVTLAMLEKKPDEALAITREMQRRNPKDAVAFGLEGDLQLARKDWDAAVAAYRQSLQLDRNTEAAVRLHATLRAGGKAAEADRLVAEWLKERPGDAAFRFHLGDMALANDEAKAEAHYRAVLEMQPRNALAMNNVAWLMVKQGRPGAAEMARKAHELFPGRPQIMDTLAQALAAERKLPQAIEMQRAAIERAPGDPQLKLNLAKLLITSGDKAAARAELEDIARLGDRFRGQAEVGAMLKAL